VRRRNPRVLLVALAFLCPLLAMAAISVVKPLFHPRYAMPAVAGLYLLLGGFLQWLGSGRSATRRVAGGAVAFALVASSVLGLDHLTTDPNYARDDYRGAIAYVTAGLQPGDAVIHNATPPFDYYYHGAAPARYFPTRPYSEANVADELNADTQGHHRLWYVMNVTIPNDPDRFVDTQLRLHAERLDERWFGALRVQLWEIPGDLAFGQATLQPVAVNLDNQFAVTGYAASGEPLGGQTLDVEMAIRASGRPAADDGFWVALVDPGGRQWGRGDARPHDAAYRLTGAWPAGESNVVRLDLPVAVGTPPGAYRLVAGAYRLSDLAGLNVLDAAQHPIGQQADLGPIAISKVTTDRGDPALKDQREAPVASGLTLLADQVEPTADRPGDRIQVTLLWKATGHLAPLHSSLLVQAANGATLARVETPVGGAFPNDEWPVGGVVRDQESLTLPATVPAGQAKLVLDLADASSGRAVGSPLTLATLDITGVARAFQPPPAAHPLEVTFGGMIGLAGYDLSSATVHPGDALTLTLDWRSIRQTSTSYHVFVHLLDIGNHVVTQWDGVPKNWQYPTSAWLPGEYVRDAYTLTIPGNSPAGPLTLEVGLYDATDGKRLTVASSDPRASGDDRVILQSVQVARR
ncbi:MAG TPA: hypothetical protein VFZ25_13110, partial [Chloroflexota bacterium]|nr:hypothetical protein [Chloroflexota bacterium]